MKKINSKLKWNPSGKPVLYFFVWSCENCIGRISHDIHHAYWWHFSKIRVIHKVWWKKHFYLIVNNLCRIQTNNLYKNWNTKLSDVNTVNIVLLTSTSELWRNFSFEMGETKYQDSVWILWRPWSFCRFCNVSSFHGVNSTGNSLQVGL